MRDITGADASSNTALLAILQTAVAACLLCTLGLYLKGHKWAREAALVAPLAAEVQRHELVLRSVLFEAYQWNQTHRSPELNELLQRLNVRVQVQSGPSNAISNPAAPRTPKAPNR